MNDLLRAWGDPIKFDRKQAYEFIPTWQRGHEQAQPNDFAKYADEGYRHSLIYSCIREIATSFADLPGRVLRRTPDGFDEAMGHPLTALLQSPNESMDAYEFSELLMTHKKSAGNVYIEKVRRSENRDRQRFFGNVKELGIIRPEYVQIKPGTTRAEDTFVIKVGGRVVKILERKDVIHIKEPNPANDFYGLSPVAVIAKEADLDTWMTDYDVAFFRNAGVPMGLLITKRRQTSDEVTQTKGAFRRAFSGLRKFFEILVISQDEAEYKPLAGMPKDLEMAVTREFGESRICSVFGVPPIIVGAGVGLKHATYSNYEQAQFSFWSETMAPEARSIASALTRELLPEFATTLDRGAKVDYDTSGVKALQEDNSDRLKGVAELVKTGGFTVNQALELHGLPAVEGGEFYVRTVAQVVESPMLATVNGRRVAASLLEPKHKFTWKAWEGKQEGVSSPARERLVERAEAALEDFLEWQASRVVGRLPKGRKQNTGDLVPSSEEQELLQLLRPYFTGATQIGWEIGGELLGDPRDFDPLDPRVVDLLQGSGERIKEITDETRRIVQEVLEEARREGLSVRQVAERLRQSAAFTQGRAARIARTELAIADNRGALKRYETANVQQVEIIDGPECLPGDVLVWAPNGTITAAMSRPYEGEVIVLSTAPDNELAVTPNHPILTLNGWVPAYQINKDDQLLQRVGQQRTVDGMMLDDEYMPTAIEKIASALIPIAAGIQTRGNFHGDGQDGQVYVVNATRSLRDGMPTDFRQSVDSPALISAHAAKSFDSQGASDLLRYGSLSPASGSVRREGSTLTLSSSMARSGQPVALADRPGAQSGVLKELKDTPALPIVTIAQLQQAFPFEIALVNVIEVNRQWFSGQVYNLSTAAGWYVANNIITHNCGWSTHDDSDFAHGSIRTLAEANATPVSHPNCVRSVIPVLER